MNNMFSNNEYAQSRAPYGARGLKSKPGKVVVMMVDVAPRMGRVD